MFVGLTKAYGYVHCSIYLGMPHTSCEETTHVMGSVCLCLWSEWPVPPLQVVLDLYFRVVKRFYK